MKKRIFLGAMIGLGTPLLVLICLPWLCIVDMLAPNLGFESSWYYYGQYNRVRNVIEAMPSVTIIRDWQHKDLSLEDFGFTLFIDEEREVVVKFLENSPEINERDRSKIREIVRRAIDSNRADI